MTRYSTSRDRDFAALLFEKLRQVDEGDRWGRVSVYQKFLRRLRRQGRQR